MSYTIRIQWSYRFHAFLRKGKANEKMFFVMVIAFVLLFCLTAFAANQNDISDDIFQEKVEGCLEERIDFQTYEDIRILLMDYPELGTILEDERTLAYLKELQCEDNVSEKDKFVNLLINYIESGFRVTDLHELTSYITIYITTRSGNSIVGKRYSNANELQNYNCHSYAWYYDRNYNSNDRLRIDSPSSYFTTTNGTCFLDVFSGEVYPSSISASYVDVGDIVTYIAFADEINGLPNNSFRIVKLSVYVPGAQIFCESHPGTPMAFLFYHTKRTASGWGRSFLYQEKLTTENFHLINGRNDFRLQ